MVSVVWRVVDSVDLGAGEVLLALPLILLRLPLGPVDAPLKVGASTRFLGLNLLEAC